MARRKEFNDLTGQKFGMLTVVGETKKPNNTNVFWECICECGNISVVRTHPLTHGLKLSCGCRPKYIDLSGMKFGRLYVKSFAYIDKKHERAMWNCVCDCGKELIVSRQALRTGSRISCGCYHHEYVMKAIDRMHKLNKKQNEIIFCDDYAKIKLSNCDEFALIDKDDVDKAKQYYWHKSRFGYVKTNKSDGKNHKGLRLHRLIIDNVPDGLTVDHINQNKLDNRKSNLRVVNQMVNNNNNYKTKARSNTGLKYIYLNPNNRYSVHYSRYGKNYWVGIFKTLSEAKEKLKENLIKNNFKELIYE